MPNIEELFGESLTAEEQKEVGSVATQKAEKLEQDRKDYAAFEAKPFYEQFAKKAQAGFESWIGDKKKALTEYVANNPSTFTNPMGTGYGINLNSIDKTRPQLLEQIKEDTKASLRQSADQNYQKADELSRGAHGIWSDLGGMAVNTGQILGVMAAHTFAPSAAVPADIAYFGDMAMTSAGGAIKEYEDYKQSIGEDPYDKKYDATKLLIGAVGAAAEMAPEIALGGLSRYMPKAVSKGFATSIMKKIISKDGGVAVENGLRRFAAEQPKLFEKFLINAGKLIDQGGSEALDEGTTELINMGKDYVYKEVQDRPDLKEIWDRELQAMKGAGMMTGLLHGPSHLAQNYVTNRVRDARGVQLASANGQVFEVTHVEEKDNNTTDNFSNRQPETIIHGITADGKEVSAKPEEIEDQATLTHEEFKEYAKGMKKGLDMQATEQVASLRNQATGKIQMALSVNQKEDEVPFYILNTHPDGTAVVMDADTGKRRMINATEINPETVTDIDEQQFYNQLRPQEQEVQETTQPETSQQASTQPAYEPGQPVAINGMMGVVSDMSSDGRMVIETPQGSIEATSDQVQPVQMITDGKNEIPSIEQEDGTMMVGEQTIDKAVAQKTADRLNQLYQGKRTFEVQSNPSGDINRPDSYQIVSRAQTEATPQFEQAAPQAEVSLPEQVQQTEKPSEPVYAINGQPVSKSYLKGIIRAADSVEDLNGVQIDNDAELQGMVEAKFPQPKAAYSFDGETIDRDEAMGIIAASKSREKLQALNIENDAELQGMIEAKFPQEAQPTPAESTELMSQEEIAAQPVLKGVVRTPRKAEFTPESRRGQLSRKEPISLRHALLNYFIQGGKVTPAMFKREVSNQPGEYGPRVGLFNNKEGTDSEDTLQERMKGQTPFADVDGQEFRNTLHDVLRDHNSVGSMMNEAESLLSKGANQVVMTPEEQRAIEEAEWMAKEEYDAQNLTEELVNSYLEAEEIYTQILANEHSNTRAAQESSSNQDQHGQDNESQVRSDAGRNPGADGSVRGSGMAADQTSQPASEHTDGNDGQLRADVRTAGEHLENRIISKEVERASSQVNQQPTEAQKEAGNYKKGHVSIQGMDITIENPKGSKRSGIDKDGKPWEVEMNNAYGYFKRTEGKDGDHVDVFIGEHPTSEKVFVVDQVDEKGAFDEHKVMMGFNSQEEAAAAYNSNYSPGWKGLGAITEMGLDEFKGWVKDGDLTKEPAATTPDALIEKRIQKRDQWNKKAIDFKNNNSPELTTATQQAIEAVEELMTRTELAARTSIGSNMDHVIEQMTLNGEPKHLIEAVRNAGNVNGFITSKGVYLNASAHPSKEAIIKSFIHEQVGHYGLDKILDSLGVNKGEFYNRVYESVGERGFETICNEIDQQDGTVMGSTYRAYQNESNETKGKEYMAFLSEKIIEGKDLTPIERSWWDVIRDYIEKFILDKFGKGVNFSDKELALIVRTASYEILGKTAETTPAKKMFGLTLANTARGDGAILQDAKGSGVYEAQITRELQRPEFVEKLTTESLKGKALALHGGAKLFNKPDNRFIGEGAGEKIHGFGHYSTLLLNDTAIPELYGRKTFEYSPVFKDYADRITEELGQGAYKKFVNAYLGVRGDESKLEERLSRDLDKSKYAQPILDFIKEHPFPSDNRYIYSYAIEPIAGEFTMIDWYHAMTDNAIWYTTLNALGNKEGIFLGHLSERMEKSEVEYFTGGDFYTALSQTVGGDKEASELLNGLGVDGVVYFDKEIQDGKERINIVSFDGDNIDVIDKPIQFKTKEEKKNLVVLHNIAADQINQAAQNGGLIAPSIAITNINNPFTDFGDVTLIGKKQLIDPQNGDVKVFAGDVYSPSMPRPEWEVDKKNLNKWSLKIINKAYDIHPSLRNNVYQAIGDYSRFVKDLSNTSAEGMVKNEQSNPDVDMKLAYLIEKGVEVKHLDKPRPFYILSGYEVELTAEEKAHAQEMMDKHREENDFYRSEEYTTFVKNVVTRNLKEKYGDLRDASEMAEKYTQNIGFSSWANLMDTLIGRRETDTDAMRSQINQLIDEKDYLNWYAEKVKQFQGDKYFTQGKKKLHYTSSNLLESIVGKTRGQEKLMTFGINKAKSFAHKQLKSIADIKKVENILTSKTEMTKIDEAYSAEYFALSDKLNYQYSSTWDKMDDMGRSLADYYKGKNVAAALRKNGFVGGDFDAFKDFADRLKAEPVDYFEAKMQREVGIEEFAHAVVPEGSEAIETLKAKGVNVVTYKTPEERHQAILDLSEKDDEIRFKKDLFFSPTQRALDNIQQNKATSQQWKAMLMKNGAKEAEMEWSGLNELLSKEKSFTKQELYDTLDANKVELEEVVKGNKYLDKDEIAQENYGKNYSELDDNQKGVVDRTSTSIPDTKYETYKTPGGKNYKEWVLTLPIQLNRDETELNALQNKFVTNGNLSDAEQKRALELQEKLGQFALRKKEASQFKSNHWSEPNVAVHIRTQEFTDKDGKRVLLLDEVQSDWAQEGKKKGFEDNNVAEKINALTQKLEEKYPNDNLSDILLKKDDPNVAELTRLYEERAYKRVPDMPFKQTPQWVSLAFRRMLRYAAENGFDTVAWSTGKQNADRYSLSKQIDSVEYYNHGGRLIAIDKEGNSVIDESDVSEDKIAEYIGKEAATKLLNSKIEERNGGAKYQLQGAGLETGGEGMKSFYDQIIPSVVSKAFKVKPYQTEIVTGDPIYADGGSEVINLETGEMEPNTGQNTGPQTTTVHSIELSSELKEKSLQPQPLFKKEWEQSGASQAATVDEALDRLNALRKNKGNHEQIAEQGKAFGHKYRQPVITIQTTSELPPHIKRKIRRGEERTVQAAVDPRTGIIYLVSQNLNPRLAEKALLHELLAHKGLREVLGENFDPILDKVYQSMSQADRDTFADIYDTQDPRLIAEEYIAYLAESYKKPNVLQQVAAQLRELLRKMFNIDYSINDIMHMLNKSEAFYNHQMKPEASEHSDTDSYLDAYNEWNRFKKTDVTETKAFRDWFEGSQVVDKEGNPLVVYHGTNEDFTEFNGFDKFNYFAEDKAYADRFRTNDGHTKEVYLSIKNQLDLTGFGTEDVHRKAFVSFLESKLGKLRPEQIEAIGANNEKAPVWIFLREDGFAFRKAIEDAGYDGIKQIENIPGEKQGNTTWVAFESSQVKSVDNNGDFDPDNNDIRFKKNHPAELSKKGDEFREKFQDKMISVKRLEQEVADRGGNIGEFSKIARSETLSYGKVKNAIERCSKELVDPVMKSAAEVIKAKGCTLSELQRYLKAKHAPERNRVISNRLKLKGETNQSGFDTAEAEKIVDTFENGLDKAMIDKLWSDINALNKFTLDRWLRDGFIAKDHYDVVSKMYQYYVPFKGYMDQDTTWEYMTRTHNNIVNPNQDAEGRQLESEDPLQNMVSMAQTAIIAGEKNRVNQNAYRLAANNKEMEDLFKVQKVWYVETDQQDAQGHNIIRETFEKPEQALFDAGKVTEKVNPKTQRIGITATQEKQHEVEVFINGQKHKVIFENPAVARALNGENVVKYDFPGFQQMSSATRWMSANLTAKNPAFIPVNTMRDIAYATAAHYIKGQKGDTGRFIKNMAIAERAMQAEQKGKGGKYVDLYKQFKENGGETGFIHSKQNEELLKEIEKDVKRYSGTNSKADKAAQAALTYSSLKFWGDTMENFAVRSENLSRFATYLTAIDRGATPEQAAFEAKEITVNFNTKGTHAAGLGGVFAFFNASVQGGQNFMSMGWNHKGKFVKASATFMAMGFLTAMSQLIFKDDEEEKEWNQLSDYMKQNYLCVGYGKGKYVSIPLPPGFRAFYAMGVMVADQIWGIQKNPTQLGLNMGSVMTGAVSPIDPVSFFKAEDNGTYMIDPRPIVPTVVLPMYDVWMNEDFAGRPITREPYSKEQERELADAGLYMKNVNGLAKWMTDRVYEMGGGDTSLYRSDNIDDNQYFHVGDMFDYNPSNIEHLVESYTGGRGKFFNQLYKTTFGITEAAYKAVKGEEEPMADFETNDIPVLSRLNRNTPGTNYQKIYYALEQEVTSYRSLKKDLEEDGKYTADNEMERKAVIFDMMQKDMKEIEKLERETLYDLSTYRRNKELKDKILKPYLKLLK